jgi:hypothetical protein
MAKRYQTKMKLRKYFHDLEQWEVAEYHAKINRINDELEELTMVRDDLYAEVKRGEREMRKKVEDDKILDLPIGAKPLSLVLRLPNE